MKKRRKATAARLHIRANQLYLNYLRLCFQAKCQQLLKLRRKEKSELIHFTKTRKPREEIVTLDEVDLHPKEAARFLGVWIDRKLRFKEHKQQILKKMSTQTFALTRLAAKTWGVNFSRAREIYTKVIRSAMAYWRSGMAHTYPLRWETEGGGQKATDNSE